jgi:hypothetical protein
MLIAGQLPVPQVSAQSTLADTINSVVTSNTWSGSAEVISVGTIFGKASTSAFDSAVVTQPYEWAWVRQLAAQNGYTSQAIDTQVKNIMSSQTMTGAVPSTYQGCWLVYHRYLAPLYDKASEWGLSSRWSKSTAISLIQSNLQAQKPLLGFSSSGGWYFAPRYYDEWIQDLDIALKLGDTSTASMLWDGVNSANWNGQYYAYRADQQNVMECEVGFFAAVIGNYKMTVSSIPNFDRISTDLYAKLLVSGWNSPLWGGASMMRHATSNSELRLQNTLGGIEALQMYYGVSDSAYKSALISLLSNGPAWKQFTTCSLFGKSDSDSNAMKAQLLLLYGIIPDSGSLAIPLNEWRYEDRTSMMPSTLFKFDYSSKTIRIPVYAGKLKFCFGSSIASYTFPSNGVYQVQFGSDWNSVTSASLVEGLTRFRFLGVTGGGEPPGDGEPPVGGEWGTNATRPPWWPSFFPWPLPGFLSTIVSTPLYMFVGVAGFLTLTLGILSLKMKPKRKSHFSTSDTR